MLLAAVPLRAVPLPMGPMSLVGSYAHPSWFYAARELIEADRFGPVDVAGTFDDDLVAGVEQVRNELA